MATPVVEQARLLALTRGVAVVSDVELQKYIQQLARTSLVVLLGPSRATLRGDETDQRLMPDYEDYYFFKEMLEKTAINEFFQQDSWGPHRVVMDTVQTEDIPRVPAYRVFWNERQCLLTLQETDTVAFEEIVKPMLASIGVLLGTDWIHWHLDNGQAVS